MRNETVRQFFTNYFLIHEQGFDVFTRDQSKLFSPNLTTLVTDIRGSFTYERIGGFFEGMAAWSKHFFVNGRSRHAYVAETRTDAWRPYTPAANERRDYQQGRSSRLD
jgi:hypothetical protein